MAALRSSLSSALLAGTLLVGCASSPSTGVATGGASGAATPAGEGSTSSGPAATAPRAPVTELDPGLVAAFEQARAAAADAGEGLVINSGHRTPERQQELLDEAVVERGSLEEAGRWVFTPERSMHVQGLAIDVGDGPAADWLDANGATWGLCRTLGWEWWHFEWRARWQEAGSCPGPVDDPADAPGP